MNKAINILDEALDLMDRGCTSWEEVYDLIVSAKDELLKLKKES